LGFKIGLRFLGGIEGKKVAIMAQIKGNERAIVFSKYPPQFEV
jgi:hypothetical protein